jgi:hypothetical protein
MRNDMCSEDIKDRLPEYAIGNVSNGLAREIQDHLRACSDCREELEVIRGLLAARPARVPSGLAARIQAGVRSELGPPIRDVPSVGQMDPGSVAPLRLRPRRVPTWALSAAAVLVLALGATVFLNRGTPDATLDPVVVAAQEPIPEEWLWDDGMIAGAPVFDDLSDEDLEVLLEEFGG